MCLSATAQMQASRKTLFQDEWGRWSREMLSLLLWFGVLIDFHHGRA
jgi:hypothetical protein